MHTLLTYLMVAALGGTLISLLLGILNMFMTTPQASYRSNKLMQWRVAAQIVVLILFSSILFLGKNH